MDHVVSLGTDSVNQVEDSFDIDNRMHILKLGENSHRFHGTLARRIKIHDDFTISLESDIVPKSLRKSEQLTKVVRCAQSDFCR